MAKLAIWNTPNLNESASRYKDKKTELLSIVTLVILLASKGRGVGSWGLKERMCMTFRLYYFAVFLFVTLA